MTQGLSNRDIAELLGISRPTLHGGRARGAHPGQVGRRVPHGDRGGREKAVALRAGRCPRPVGVAS
ncbi:winged helix-turn-helix domain-containing protein [Streptomyces sp. NPDC058321]|uniref:winged helix-turn-helix domain-containing protein n=1 Tax=Streptomyces sp. NPDC058321 TaxID=3346445 RepID=UPI0036E3E268